MEYLALYRKYRPTKFSDVVDQESILKILTNSLKENKISHAYLFSGPRGTGKTTIAKLIAKTVNCLNLNEDFSICGKCENCLDILNNSTDIIEIDAASNNGVEEIRELKSKINLVPSKLKYKVYIIDEVHMLSISAFNALLKTLEEPPSHVIFILATTEFYKVPQTIISRCQCLTFKRISQEGLEKRLREIADLEHIKITDDAIKEIAIYSEGGMRDALGMLDKLASYSLEEITANDFLRINGLISNLDLDEFIKMILAKNNQDVINKINDFEDNGIDYSKLIEKILERLRDLLVEHFTSKDSNEFNPQELYNLIFVFNDIYKLLKEAVNRKIIFEVKLLEYMNLVVKEDVKKIEIETNKESNVNKNISQEIKKKNIKNDIAIQKNEGNEIKKYLINEKIKKQRINNTFAMASKILKNMVVEKFDLINNYIMNSTYGEVAGYLKDLTVGVVSDKNIILVSKHESLIDKMYSNYNLCLELIKNITDMEYKIVILTNDEFNQEVNNFKLHMNDKNYYNYVEEDDDFLQLNMDKEENICYGSLVTKAIDMFGKDIIEIEKEN